MASQQSASWPAASVLPAGACVLFAVLRQTRTAPCHWAGPGRIRPFTVTSGSQHRTCRPGGPACWGLESRTIWRRFRQIPVTPPPAPPTGKRTGTAQPQEAGAGLDKPGHWHVPFGGCFLSIKMLPKERKLKINPNLKKKGCCRGRIWQARALRCTLASLCPSRWLVCPFPADEGSLQSR